METEYLSEKYEESQIIREKLIVIFFGLHENFNILSNTCSLYKHFPHIFVCFVSGYKNGSLESLTKFHFPFDQTQEFKSSQKSVFCDVTIDKLPLYKLFLHTQTPTRFYLN